MMKYKEFMGKKMPKFDPQNPGDSLVQVVAYFGAVIVDVANLEESLQVVVDVELVTTIFVSNGTITTSQFARGCQSVATTPTPGVSGHTSTLLDILAHGCVKDPLLFQLKVVKRSCKAVKNSFLNTPQSCSASVMEECLTKFLGKLSGYLLMYSVLRRASALPQAGNAGVSCSESDHKWAVDHVKTCIIPLSYMWIVEGEQAKGKGSIQLIASLLVTLKRLVVSTGTPNPQSTDSTPKGVTGQQQSKIPKVYMGQSVSHGDTDSEQRTDGAHGRYPPAMRNEPNGMCWQWEKGEQCSWGSSCRFKHGDTAPIDDLPHNRRYDAGGFRGRGGRGGRGGKGSPSRFDRGKGRQFTAECRDFARGDCKRERECMFLHDGHEPKSAHWTEVRLAAHKVRVASMHGQPTYPVHSERKNNIDGGQSAGQKNGANP
jgi:hypothetical protein